MITLLFLFAFVYPSTQSSNYLKVDSAFGNSLRLQELVFASDSVGFALLRGPKYNQVKIFLTRNGGTSWAFLPDVPIHAIHTDREIAIIPAGASGCLLGNNSVILRTLDSGHTWTQLDVLLPSEGLKLVFPSVMCGFAMSSHQLVHTTDGGLTWLNALPSKDSVQRWTPSWMEFYNENEGVLTGWCFRDTVSEHFFLQTRDAGKHWSSFPGKFPSEFDYVHRLKGQIYVTHRYFSNDACNSWFPLVNSQSKFFGSNGKKLPTLELRGLIEGFDDFQRCFTTHFEGETLKQFGSTDFGKTWRVINTPPMIHAHVVSSPSKTYLYNEKYLYFLDGK